MKPAITERVEEPLVTGDWAPLWNLLASENRPPKPGTRPDDEQFPALSGLLLHLAPNLRSISFCGGSPLPYYNGYMRALWRWNAALPAKSVTRLSFIASTPRPFNNPRFGFGDFAHILQAVPNLEVLRLHGCNTAIPGHVRSVLSQAPMKMPARMENLTELALIDCHITFMHLSDLAAEALGPNLSRVIIRQSEGGHGTGVETMELEDIFRVLRPWTKTLRELTHCSFQRDKSLLGRDRTLSLPAFRALEVLDVTSDAIYLHYLEHQNTALATCVPPSIRKLRLAGRVYLTLIVKEILVARESGRLPNLATIEVNEQHEWHDNTRYDFPDQYTEMMAVAPGLRSAGVEIVVHPLDQEL